jgi:predicted esterase
VDPIARTIETPIHGRYLVAAPAGVPAGLLVGFHGYAENAETHLAALQAIPGSRQWQLVAVQGLHPFYTRDQRIVANWMTSQDRELAIADNIGYARRVVEAVRREVPGPVVFAGFSQGGAMAYRAAAHLGAAGLFILAADVPPDVTDLQTLQLPPVLIGRGTTDPWYTADKQAADIAALDRRGVRVENCVFDGGHEWGKDFVAAAAAYLESVRRRS